MSTPEKHMGAQTRFLDFDTSASTPVVKGTLNGGLEALRVAVPADVRVVAGRLEWIPVGANFEWWPDGGIAARALDAFIRLATEPREERFADFVREYGVLGLQECGLPACGSDHSLDNPPQLVDPWQGCAVSWEPIAAYRHYAAGAKAMLCLAAALKRARGTAPVSAHALFSEVGLAVDTRGSWDRVWAICRVWQEMSGKTWEEWAESGTGHDAVMNMLAVETAHIAENFTYSTGLYGPLENPSEYAVIQREKFGYWLTRFWIKRAGLAPTITWSEDRPQLGLSVGRRREDRFELWPPNSLFRVLAAHLAARVCEGPNMATCSHCGGVFFSARRPRIDQNRYCEMCRRTAASRRTRGWRDRHRPVDVP